MGPAWCTQRARAAFLFPGQGAKRVDAALRAAVRGARGRARCELAARAAGVDLEGVLRRPSLLDRTEIYQPIVTAIGLAAAEALGEVGVAPEVVLGHSLGEVAAWSAAGAISTEDAIELAALRGRLMAREAAAHPGGMVALGTDDEAVIEAALVVGRRSGALGLAARNAPDETVLTGDEAAVRAVLAFAPDLATRVPTAGAWHGPAMAGAVAEWGSAVARVTRAEPRCAFVANRTGDVVAAGDIPDCVAGQLVRPVLWARSLATVGPRSDVVVILGPGAVLRSLWHRHVRAGTPVRETAGGAGAREPATVPRRAGEDGTWATPQKMFTTEDERSLAETIAALRTEHSLSLSLTAP